MRLLGWRWSYWLDQDHRDHWITHAGLILLTDDRFGTYHLNGWGLYVKVNQPLKLISAALLDDPPEDLACGSPDGASLIIAGAPPTLKVHVTTDPAAHEHAYIAAVYPLHPGALYTKKLTRKMNTFGAGVPHPYDITAEYTARYGALQSGQGINVLVNFISDLTGGQGTAQTAQALVP